ncbi:hypothetical protein Tco_0713649 [Tanacetum coccineum]
MLKHPIHESTFRRGILGTAPCVLPSAFSTMANRDPTWNMDTVKDFLTRHILLRCDSSGDLYPVTPPSPTPHALLPVSPSTWHQRLGLPSEDVLDENPICTLEDYYRPSDEGYRNTIELPEGNNVVPLRSDAIRLVQNGCSFHRLWSEDPKQHLKDFLKLMDSLNLDVVNRERTCLRLFQFSLCDQASNRFERLPA